MIVLSRKLFHERMDQVKEGGVLERKGRRWVVTSHHLEDTCVHMMLRHGRRTFRLIVSYTIWGPHIWEAGFRSVSGPPSQREMFAQGSGL